MKRRRIFVPADEVAEGRIVFSAKDIHYLKRVLRLRSGDSVEVFDGMRAHAVQLESGHAGDLVGRVLETAPQREEPQGIHVTLAFACVRPGPFGDILRHGTELGICRFVPLLSRRVTRKPAEKKERWEAIVKSAAEQCGRVQCPDVVAPVAFGEFLETELGDITKLLLSPDPRARAMLDVLERDRPSAAVLLVGPEGGFDEDEEAHAQRVGFVPVSLGQRILRAETAALVAGGILAVWYDRHARNHAGNTCKNPSVE